MIKILKQYLFKNKYTFQIKYTPNIVENTIPSSDKRDNSSLMVNLSVGLLFEQSTCYGSPPTLSPVKM
jgi:hypothetical protein